MLPLIRSSSERRRPTTTSRKPAAGLHRGPKSSRRIWRFRNGTMKRPLASCDPARQMERPCMAQSVQPPLATSQPRTPISLGCTVRSTCPGLRKLKPRAAVCLSAPALSKFLPWAGNSGRTPAVSSIPCGWRGRPRWWLECCNKSRLRCHQPQSKTPCRHFFLLCRKAPQSFRNLGVLPFAVEYGSLRLKAVWGPAMLTNLPAHRQTIGVSRFAGQLRMVHQSYEPISGLLKSIREISLASCA